MSDTFSTEEELRALRGSAAALNKSDYEVTKRLENAYDHISLMLEALHDHSSTQTLKDIDDGIEILIERLADTQTILRLVLRERELEQKLADLDLEAARRVVEVEESKYEILEKLKRGERIFDDEDDEGDPLAADPDVLKKIEQRQQLESLIDSLFATPKADRVKKFIEKVSPSPPITKLIGTLYGKIPRPLRDLDANIPTAKGKGYEIPKTPEPK